MPTVVQSANSGGTGSSVTVTLGSATTAGNCLVVKIGGLSASSSVPTVTGVTIGGVASNFGLIKSATVTNGVTTAGGAFIWACPNCPGGQTSVVVSGTSLRGVVVDEVSGLAATLAGLLDQFSTGSNSTAGTSWSSGTSGTTTSAAEYIGGVASAGNGTMTGPGAPWSNTSPVAGTIAGQQISSAAGTFTYSGTVGTSAIWAAVVVTLNPAGPPAPAPFTPPQRSRRGAPGAVRGRAASSPGAPWYWTLFAGQGGSALTSDATSYTLGVQFSVTEPSCILAAIRFYSPPGAAALPTVIALFNAGTAALVHSETASWSAAAGGGVVRAAFTAPPSLITGTNYVAAILQPLSVNWYSSFSHYWDTGPGANGITDPPLSAPNNAGSLRGQDTFNNGNTLTFPASTFNATNYWIDPEIQVVTPPPSPAPFTPPQRAPRGAPGARRGRSASSRGAPVRQRRTLLISLASAAGTDDYGNAFPEGILATAGVIEGPTLIGSDAFYYFPSPGFGNLASSNAAGPGSDQFGNSYVGGAAAYTGVGSNWFAVSLFGGGIAFYHATSAAGGWTLQGQLDLISPGELVAQFASVSLNNSAAQAIPAAPPSVSGADGIAIVSALTAVGIFT